MATQLSEDELDRFFEVAMELVRQGGEMINKAIYSSKKVEEKSSATDLVTETDKAVENLLVNGLRTKFPDHKFIGEEDTAAAKDGVVSEFTDLPTWIIDPIDGTMNFVHSHPMVCISVGLVINKIPVLGIVHAPVLGRFYSAKRGKGAFLNGDPIKVSGCEKMIKAMFLFEVWAQETAESGKRQDTNIQSVVMAAQSVRCVGSAAINLAMVAAGEADAYAQVGIRCWDIVAGALIAKEAGAYVADPRDESKPFDYMSRGILATASHKLAKEVYDLALSYNNPQRDHPDSGPL